MGVVLFEFVSSVDDPRLRVNPSITDERYEPVSPADPVRGMLEKLSRIDPSDFPQYSFWINTGTVTITYNPFFKNCTTGIVMVLRNRLWMGYFQGIDQSFYNRLIDDVLIDRDCELELRSMQNNETCFVSHHKLNSYLYDHVFINGDVFLPHCEIDDVVHGFMASLINVLHFRNVKVFLDHLPLRELPQILQVIRSADICIPDFLSRPLHQISLIHNGFSNEDLERLQEKYF